VLKPLKFTPKLEHYEVVLKIFQQNDFEPIQGVEVGVRHGDFAEYILRNCWTLQTYWAVDPYLPYKDLEYMFTQEEQNKIKEEAAKRLWAYSDNTEHTDPTLQWIYLPSKIAAQGFSNQRGAEPSLDFVFIDAEHTYESVLRDILSWIGHIRPGGILMGHDYSMKGVKAAVNDFHYYTVNRETSDVLHTGTESDVWAIRV